jgi:ADP-ribose pyrophosphatase
MNEAWPRLKPDEEIKVGWRTLVRKTFKQPDGQPAEYVTKDAMGKVSVAIIALTRDNNVVIAEQFRPGPERVLQELPGGGADKDEDYAVAALRELREETGYVSSDVTYLGKVFKDAYTNTVSHYYLAKDCQMLHKQELDDYEFVDVKLVSIGELLDNARSARMTDCEAVFLAYDELKKLTTEGISPRSVDFAK